MWHQECSSNIAHQDDMLNNAAVVTQIEYLVSLWRYTEDW